MSWQVGLLIVIALPLVVLVVAVFWPERVPEDRTVGPFGIASRGLDRPPISGCGTPIATWGIR